MFKKRNFDLKAKVKNRTRNKQLQKYTKYNYIIYILYACIKFIRDEIIRRINV